MAVAHYAAAHGSNGELMDVGERHTEHDGGTWTNMKDTSLATRLMPIRVVRLRLDPCSVEGGKKKFA